MNDVERPYVKYRLKISINRGWTKEFVMNDKHLVCTCAS